MKVEKFRFYNEIAEQVSKEFDVPQLLIYDIINNIFSDVVEVIKNYPQYLMTKSYYSIYLPVLGKLTVTLKGKMIYDVIQEEQIRLQKEEDLKNNNSKVSITKNRSGLLKFKIINKDKPITKDNFINNGEL